MTERESGTYRRGLTLGLTMAEIFILILFLLLLVLLSLKEELEAANKNLIHAQTELAETKNNLEEARSLLPEDMAKLTRNNEQQEKTIERLEQENTIAKALLEEVNESAQALREKVDSFEDALTLDKEQNTEVEQQLENVQQENVQLRAALYARKGVDPPCWYEVVTRQDERHEKPYYLLDIAVHDDYLLVRLHQAPLGRAIDEQEQPAVTSYAEEYVTLPLEPLIATKKVLLAEFESIAEPIKRMGKNKQVRNYACVFYAKIWDFTSTTAKKRWQRARETIENFFYPLLIRNDPW